MVLWIEKRACRQICSCEYSILLPFRALQLAATELAGVFASFKGVFVLGGDTPNTGALHVCIGDSGRKYNPAADHLILWKQLTARKVGPPIAGVELDLIYG